MCIAVLGVVELAKLLSMLLASSSETPILINTASLSSSGVGASAYSFELEVVAT
jgi:hypothetical protein